MNRVDYQLHPFAREPDGFVAHRAALGLFGGIKSYDEVTRTLSCAH